MEFIESYWPLLLVIIIGLSAWQLYENRKKISFPSFGRKSSSQRTITPPAVSVTPTTPTTSTTPVAPATTPPTPKKKRWSVWSWIGFVVALVVALAAVIFVIFFLWTAGSGFFRWVNKPSEPSYYVVPQKIQQQSIPLSSGEGFIPKEGLTIYLDPEKTHTRPRGIVKYTSNDDPSKWVIEKGPANKNTGIDVGKMHDMPVGYCKVTALSKNAYLRWWQ